MFVQTLALNMPVLAYGICRTGLTLKMKKFPQKKPLNSNTCNFFSKVDGKMLPCTEAPVKACQTQYCWQNNASLYCRTHYKEFSEDGDCRRCGTKVISLVVVQCSFKSSGKNCTKKPVAGCQNDRCPKNDDGVEGPSYYCEDHEKTLVEQEETCRRCSMKVIKLVESFASWFAECSENGVPVAPKLIKSLRESAKLRMKLKGIFYVLKPEERGVVLETLKIAFNTQIVAKMSIAAKIRALTKEDNLNWKKLMREGLRLTFQAVVNLVVPGLGTLLGLIFWKHFVENGTEQTFLEKIKLLYEKLKLFWEKLKEKLKPSSSKTFQHYVDAVKNKEKINLETEIQKMENNLGRTEYSAHNGVCDVISIVIGFVTGVPFLIKLLLSAINVVSELCLDWFRSKVKGESESAILKTCEKNLRELKEAVQLLKGNHHNMRKYLNLPEMFMDAEDELLKNQEVEAEAAVLKAKERFEQASEKPICEWIKQWWRTSF